MFHASLLQQLTRSIIKNSLSTYIPKKYQKNAYKYKTDKKNNLRIRFFASTENQQKLTSASLHKNRLTIINGYNCSVYPKPQQIVVFFFISVYIIICKHYIIMIIIWYYRYGFPSRHVVIRIKLVTDCDIGTQCTNPKTFVDGTCTIDLRWGGYECMIINSRKLNGAYRETFYRDDYTKHNQYIH